MALRTVPGTIGMGHLVRSTLRLRPDRIIVGEVRGGEAFDLLQALNTGHLGSLTTIHGNSAAQAFFDEAVRRARGHKISISIPRLKPKQMGCQTVETFYVDIKGNVAPCDFLGVTTPFTLWEKTTSNPPVIFGNILITDPMEIYRSKEARQFREDHRLGRELPVQCRDWIDAYR